MWQGKTNFAHCLPVIKTPVDNLVIQDFYRVNTVTCGIIRLRPDEDGGPCLISYAVGGICPSCCVKSGIATFLEPSIERSQSKLYKGAADIEIEAFSCGER